MPHVAFVPLTGFRVAEQRMRELGMSLPGFRQRSQAIAELPALGLLTLAGMTPDRWTSSYHAAAAVDQQLVERLLAERPTLVAVSALTASIDEAYRLCQQLRRHAVATVLGGLHATACAEEAQQYCDAVVVGGGEPVWLQLLDDAERGRLQRRYGTTAARPEGDRWPQPRWELLGPQPPRFTLQTQRGCPLACDFCGASRLLGRFREKPLAAIRRELQAILAVKQRPLLELADDNTFAGDRDASELLDLLKSSGARWFTEADWRIGERPDVLYHLADAGCVQVLVGIESLVFRYPGMGEKRAELERVMAAVQSIQEAGVVVNGCFIVGATGETHDSMDRLVAFILDSPLAEVQLTLQTPFPGTGLYRRLKNENRLLRDRGWSCYTLFDVTFQPDSMSVAELEFGFRRVVQQVYGGHATRRRQEIRRRVWRRNRRLCP